MRRSPNVWSVNDRVRVGPWGNNGIEFDEVRICAIEGGKVNVEVLSPPLHQGQRWGVPLSALKEL